MISSNEIRNTRFEIVKKGYSPEAVDELMEAITATIDALMTEKSENEQQLILLADKLEEYRADEDKIKTTLLGAQKMSDSIIREAKQKADIVLRDATIKSERLIEGSRAKVEKEEEVFDRIKKEIGNFKNEILSIYKNHLEVLSQIPDYEEGSAESEPEHIPAPAPQPEPTPAPVRDIVESAEEPLPSDDVEGFVAELDLSAAEKNEPPLTHEFSAEDFSLDISIDDKKDEPAEEVKFGKLDFGEDYTFDK